jgi:DNA-binding winged helix-turn-helix (wHTH) protein
VKLTFSDCTLDLEARRLFRGVREIRLPPKAFELLKVLVEVHPRALAKSELIERIWQGVFVSDASLARVVTELREALDDRARDARIIRTVHRYGYAFVAAIEAVEPAAAPSGAGTSVCWLVSGDRTFGLSDGEHIAGREPGVSVWLDSPKVSRHHARLVVQGCAATIEDLHSTNGTFVRDVRISSPARLEPGDRVRIGPFSLTLRITGRLAATEPEGQQES